MTKPEELAQAVHEELDYLHARVDQLIRQMAIEVGVNDQRTRKLNQEQWREAMQLASNRLWGADDMIAEQFNRLKRTRS